MACADDKETNLSELMEWFDTNEARTDWCFCPDEIEEDQLQRFVIDHKRENIKFVINAVSTDDRHRYFTVTSNNEQVNSHLSSSRMSSIQECMESSTAALKDLSFRKDEEEEEEEEEEEDGDDYDEEYQEESMYPDEEPMVTPQPSAIPEAYALPHFCHSTNSTAAMRLLIDLKAFERSNGHFGIRGRPRGDNLFHWDAQLTDFDASLPLAKDLVAYAKKHKRTPEIHLEMIFPPDYPMSPPFIRVIRPRFEFLTGHVTIGGSICMELLTKSGWKPVFEIENILIQVRSAIMSDTNARLNSANADKEYTEAEARAAFTRMVKNYGWD